MEFTIAITGSDTLTDTLGVQGYDLGAGPITIYDGITDILVYDARLTSGAPINVLYNVEGTPKQVDPNAAA